MALLRRCLLELRSAMHPTEGFGASAMLEFTAQHPFALSLPLDAPERAYPLRANPSPLALPAWQGMGGTPDDGSASQ